MRSSSTSTPATLAPSKGFQRRITADVKALQQQIEGLAAEVARGTEAERFAVLTDADRLAPVVVAVLALRPRRRRLQLHPKLHHQVVARLTAADGEPVDAIHRWLQEQPAASVTRSSLHRFAADVDAAHQQVVAALLGRVATVA